MKNLIFSVLATLLLASFSLPAYAVAGHGSGTEVTGNGTGANAEVTGNGTGANAEVTGNGTGANTEAFEDGALSSCHTGSWYDPLIPSEGISLEVLQDGYVVAYFYTYDGNGVQTWYVFQGPDGASLDAVDILDREPVDVGDGSLTAISNDSVYFAWRFSLDLDVLSPTRPIPWCLTTACDGERSYVRLTQPIPCED